MLASALALAWHSTLALGGVTSPSQRPSHMTDASPLASHEARTPPSQPASGLVTVHSPLQLPEQLAEASSSTSQLPMQVPSHLPAHSPIVFITLQVPSHAPLQVPEQSAAAEPSTEQVPLHSPSHATDGAVTVHLR